MSKGKQSKRSRLNLMSTQAPNIVDMRFLLSLCMICTLAACSMAPAPLTEAEVLETIQAYETAWIQRDTATVDSC